MELRVTTIEELQKYGAGQLVELPSFAEGMPFVAKLKRPSMMAMMKSGKIPNSLLSTANTLFSNKQTEVAMEDDNLYRDVFEITEILADAALVEPTYQQIKEAGLELTDQQYMFIFNYTQVGVKALEPFREEQAGTENNQSIQLVQGSPQ